MVGAGDIKAGTIVEGCPNHECEYKGEHHSGHLVLVCLTDICACNYSEKVFFIRKGLKA